MAEKRLVALDIEGHGIHSQIEYLVATVVVHETAKDYVAVSIPTDFACILLPSLQRHEPS